MKNADLGQVVNLCRSICHPKSIFYRYMWLALFSVIANQQKITAQQIRNYNLKASISRGPISVVKDTFKADGFLGFYNGFVATVAREMPGYFFFFGGYETSKYFLATTNDMKTEPYGKLWCLS